MLERYMIIESIITLIMLLISMYSDMKTHLIKNVVPLTGIVLGCICSLFNHNNLLYSILTSIVLFIILFFIPRSLRINEFMGAGDIKIFIAISFIMGTKVLIYTFVYFAFICFPCLLFLNRKRMEYIFMNTINVFKNRKLYTEIIDSQTPNIFSPYILTGFVVTYIQLFILNNDWMFNMINGLETTILLKSLIERILG